jgi:cytochrome c peroxidase
MAVFGKTLGVAALLILAATAAAGVDNDGLRLSAKSPAVRLGDRLFFETRFAQFFFARCHGDVNATLAEGDPIIDQMPFRPERSLTSPFRGKSMNCRQCHLGDDFLAEEPLAGRTYVDFSRRSPIPARGDGLTHTPRNSPTMVSLGLPREAPMLLHFDGEFATPEDLVIDTLTGRNFGWLPEERAAAIAHVANVIRGDEGRNPRLVTYPDGGGVPYRVALLASDPRLPPELRISREYRVDVAAASDDEIVQAVAKLMRAYMNSLRFGTTNTGRESRSPYDVFLAQNGLPAQPARGETAGAYARRLLALLAARKSFRWVTDDDGELELHEQPFEFGATELRGLKLFLTRGDDASTKNARGAPAGNCVACHPPPQFTDHRLHNNGAAQAEYDRIFGAGAFAKLEVPTLAERNAAFDAYLPPSPRHPRASGRFRAAPATGTPSHADLGVWNVFANPDMPKPQAALTRVMCEDLGRTAERCTAASVLPATVARFKTPAIRDLGQSGPYFHSGAMDSIEDVLRFYVATSTLARAGGLRNPAPELAAIRLAASDVAPLAAFLRSLHEDYQ